MPYFTRFYMQKAIIMKKFVLIIPVFFLISALFWPVTNVDFNKPIIIFQHAFKPGDFLEKKLYELIQNYNKRPDSKGYIILQAGGDYTESFKNLISGKTYPLPHIAMIAEYNSVSMYKHKALYIPIHTILNVDAISFFPVIRSFYSFFGKMVSYPFNCSVSALYYNKEAFKQAGLPDRAPETWEEIAQFSKQLQEKGLGGFTFAWPAAYVLENFSVIHNIPFASYSNGFTDPEKAKLLIDAPLFINQLNFLQDLTKKGLLIYAGDRAEDAEQLFLEGKVNILMQGANRYGLLKSKNPDLNIGVGAYPYKSSLIKKPYALNIGGTSLWVIKGHPRKTYKAVADFLSYLSSSFVQAKWHEDTSYLPVTQKAYQLTLRSNFYEKNPAALIAIEQINRFPQALPNGIRMANYGDIRQELVNMIGRILKNFKTVSLEVTTTVNHINFNNIYE